MNDVHIRRSESLLAQRLGPAARLVLFIPLLLALLAACGNGSGGTGY